MRSNIDAVATSLPKAVAAEWFNANLVQHAARITELQFGVEKLNSVSVKIYY